MTGFSLIAKPRLVSSLDKDAAVQLGSSSAWISISLSLASSDSSIVLILQLGLFTCGSIPSSISAPFGSLSSLELNSFIVLLCK
jgi:hypothetical protein